MGMGINKAGQNQAPSGVDGGVGFKLIKQILTGTHRGQPSGFNGQGASLNQTELAQALAALGAASQCQ
jgi:hypothetical protein